MIKLKLHILLAEKRMSQKQLCELTGIRSSTMSAYYNDTYKHIVRDHLDLMCKILDCQVDDLIEFTDSSETHKTTFAKRKLKISKKKLFEDEE